MPKNQEVEHSLMDQDSQDFLDNMDNCVKIVEKRLVGKKELGKLRKRQALLANRA
jgi:hypothetical protein